MYLIAMYHSYYSILIEHSLISDSNIFFNSCWNLAEFYVFLAGFKIDQGKPIEISTVCYSRSF